MKKEKPQVFANCSLPLSLMWSPNPDLPRSIGMGISDTEIVLKRDDQVLGKIIACVGGGLMITINDGDDRYVYGLNMKDLWVAVAEEHKRFKDQFAKE